MAGGVRDIHLSRNALLALVTVIGLVVIAVLVYFLISGEEDPEEQQPEPRAVRPVPPPSQTLQGQPDLYNGEEETQSFTPDPDQTRAVIDNARGFADAWLANDREKTAWLNTVSRYGTDGFNRQMATIDLRAITPQRRTGEPTELQQTENSSTASVPLDTGNLILRFNETEGEWLIASYDFERPTS